MTKKKTDEVPMFEHENLKYPFFVANRTGTIGTPIVPPGASKPVAIVGADFVWRETDSFLKHLDLKLRDERNVREDETVRKRANLTQQNANLFEALCQGGYIIKIDDTGDRSEPVTKTRTEMLQYQPEVQSQIVDDWLGNFHIERLVTNLDIDALLSTPDSIFFTCKVGNYKNPTHLMIFEFNVPSPDARRSYESDTLIAGSKQEGDKMVSYYYINHGAKMRFAKKYFKGVRGAMLGKDGEVNIDTADLRTVEFSDPDQRLEFLSAFNPHWWIRLADSLAECFNFGGK